MPRWGFERAGLNTGNGVPCGPNIKGSRDEERICSMPYRVFFKLLESWLAQGPAKTSPLALRQSL